MSFRGANCVQCSPRLGGHRLVGMKTQPQKLTRKCEVTAILVLYGLPRKNADHVRSVIASLVKGAYVLERDRRGKREGSQALAPPWWETFGFQLKRILVDGADSSIFGAIFGLWLLQEFFFGGLRSDAAAHFSLASYYYIRCCVPTKTRLQPPAILRWSG
ncbi:GDSL esterase/lipase At4g10955-like [Eucalyptus grandis]|uniref:GDSL esterase/lipase At4g10955-like n=1 Tax=Eucalyptus grandis TaxID=71139 RepID=UPI00192E9CC8|nr:GDSL esterase/lipase At4g10955-like [Eucalyptus grandis]